MALCLQRVSFLSCQTGLPAATCQYSVSSGGVTQVLSITINNRSIHGPFRILVFKKIDSFRSGF